MRRADLHPNYLFEIKWDGERAIAFVENEKIVRLQNRGLQDVSTRYPEIIGSPVEAGEAILDGETVLLEKDGKPSFSKLAQRSHFQDPFKIKLLSKAMPGSPDYADSKIGSGINCLPFSSTSFHLLLTVF